MNPFALLTVYCVLILLASLLGGWLPMKLRLTHTGLQVATSFVAGLMLGIGVLHMLPHAWHELGGIDLTMQWMLAGLLVMFFVQRYFHFHHHDVSEEAPETAHVAGHGHNQDTHDTPASTLADRSAHQLSWTGAAFGLSLHTIINGVALAASVTAGLDGRNGAGLAGIGTFLVIFLHKPFDAMTISTLMGAGGWSRSMRHVVNLAFALAIPVGVMLFYLGAGHFSDASSTFIGAALAFAGGSFICIAASDLLPELQFHSHDRGKLSLALLAGLGLAVGIGKFEHTGHDHLIETEDAVEHLHEH